MRFNNDPRRLPSEVELEGSKKRAPKFKIMDNAILIRCSEFTGYRALAIKIITGFIPYEELFNSYVNLFTLHTEHVL